MSGTNLLFSILGSVAILLTYEATETQTVETPIPIEDTPTYSPNVSLNNPPCIQMYNAIEKYADEYGIPKRYAYGVAFKETRYEGPFHWNYKHTQTSCVGALGPMQIMLPTGRSHWKGETVTAQRLMNDIDFNVHTSMKVLRKLYDKYGDWKIVFGCYNTGRPIINNYAVDVYNYQIRFKKNVNNF
jgi:soluble lytic murein transglycosylase-like protein